MTPEPSAHAPAAAPAAAQAPPTTASSAVFDSWDDLFAARLLIVTGKGGVGKTTVAAALAKAAHASGRRTLLVEVEGRQGFSRTFGTQPWDYEEREFRPGIFGMAIDPADSVYEYLEMYYGIKRVQWLMEKSNAIDFVTTAAPGLRDLLLIGKVYEIETRLGPDGRPAYDTIILDAPPTGRILPFLQAPEGVTEIVRVGAIKRQAAQIKEMLTTPSRSAAVIVSLLEEMPVREAREGAQMLAAAGVSLGPFVANQVIIPRLGQDEAAALRDRGADGVQADAADVGVTLTPEAARLGIDLATTHAGRLDLQRELLRELEDLDEGLPVLALPQLTGATFDEQDLEILADHLAVQAGEEGPRADEHELVATMRRTS